MVVYDQRRATAVPLPAGEEGDVVGVVRPRARDDAGAAPADAGHGAVQLVASPTPGTSTSTGSEQTTRSTWVAMAPDEERSAISGKLMS